MRWLPAFTGALATATAVVVLATMSMSNSAPPVKAFAAPAPPVPVEASTPPVTVVEDADVPVAVSGVDETVSGALRDAGYAQFVDAGELSGLPTSVLDALIGEGAVLVIAEDG